MKNTLCLSICLFTLACGAQPNPQPQPVQRDRYERPVARFAVAEGFVVTGKALPRPGDALAPDQLLIVQTSDGPIDLVCGMVNCRRATEEDFKLVRQVIADNRAAAKERTEQALREREVAAQESMALSGAQGRRY